jgi:hypothetical protein
VIATDDGTSSGKVVSYPSGLRNSGTGFSTYLTS